MPQEGDEETLSAKQFIEELMGSDFAEKHAKRLIEHPLQAPADSTLPQYSDKDKAMIMRIEKLEKCVKMMGELLMEVLPAIAEHINKEQGASNDQ
jgi:hypothetical protein